MANHFWGSRVGRNLSGVEVPLLIVICRLRRERGISPGGRRMQGIREKALSIRGVMRLLTLHWITLQLPRISPRSRDIPMGIRIRGITRMLGGGGRSLAGERRTMESHRNTFSRAIKRFLQGRWILVHMLPPFLAINPFLRPIKTMSSMRNPRDMLSILQGLLQMSNYTPSRSLRTLLSTVRETKRWGAGYRGINSHTGWGRWPSLHMSCRGSPMRTREGETICIMIIGKSSLRNIDTSILLIRWVGRGMKMDHRVGKMAGLDSIGLDSTKGNRPLKRRLRILQRKVIRVGSNLAQPRSKNLSLRNPNNSNKSWRS